MKKPSPKLQKSRPAGNAVEPASKSDEGSLVSAMDLIWRVLAGRRYAIPETDIPDIAQEAILRLLKWRKKHRERASGLNTSEWHSYSAMTAHNEINRYFSNQLRGSEVPLDDATVPAKGSPEGDADSKMFFLVQAFWQEICSLTLYQRRALLLGGSELVVYLTQFGVSEEAVVASLEISNEDWADIFGRLPLSDREIAGIARSSKLIANPEAAMRAIAKARFDARKKLGRLRK